MWMVESYGSGTVVVTGESGMYFYVRANDEKYRREVAIDLEVYLNHNRVPAWFETLAMRDGSETEIVGTKGISLAVSGPMVLPEDDNGKLNWVQDGSIKAVTERSRLINRIMDEVSSCKNMAAQNAHTEIRELLVEAFTKKMRDFSSEDRTLDANGRHILATRLCSSAVQSFVEKYIDPNHKSSDWSKTFKVLRDRLMGEV